MVILNSKMVKSKFGIIFILTAVKNYNSNFADSPFGPDYCSSSIASITAPSISNIIQCIFKIYQIIVDFSKIVFFFLFLTFLKFKLINIKISLPQWNFACTFTLLSDILKDVILIYFFTVIMKHPVLLIWCWHFLFFAAFQNISWMHFFSHISWVVIVCCTH